MANEKSARPLTSNDEAAVHCLRTGRALAITEHLRCPYCFGSKADVGSNERVRFCDYNPVADPVVFGFPPRFGRHLAS